MWSFLVSICEEAITQSNVLARLEATHELGVGRFRCEDDIPKPTTVCDAAGCSSKGTITCERRHLAKYCCKECQKAAWKTHKKVYKRAVQNTMAETFESQVAEVAADRRKAASAETGKQAEDADCDYVLTARTDKDVGVIF